MLDQKFAYLPTANSLNRTLTSRFDFLKTYGTEETIATRFRVDPQTVRTWVWRIIFWIADLAPSLVSTSYM